jgi:hypothetical protein
MSKEYSAADVKQHNAEGNAWIIIDDGVYDISKFAPLHPVCTVLFNIAVLISFSYLIIYLTVSLLCCEG